MWSGRIIGANKKEQAIYGNRSNAKCFWNWNDLSQHLTTEFLPFLSQTSKILNQLLFEYKNYDASFRMKIHNTQSPISYARFLSFFLSAFQYQNICPRMIPFIITATTYMTMTSASPVSFTDVYTRARHPPNCNATEMSDSWPVLPSR